MIAAPTSCPKGRTRQRGKRTAALALARSGSGSGSGSDSSSSDDDDDVLRSARRRAADKKKKPTPSSVSSASTSSTGSTAAAATPTASEPPAAHLRAMSGPLRDRIREWQARRTLQIPTEVATRIERDADAMASATSDTAIHAASLSLMGTLLDRLEAAMEQSANAGTFAPETRERIKEVATSAHELRDAMLMDAEELIVGSKNLTARLEKMLQSGQRVLQTNTSVLRALVRDGQGAEGAEAEKAATP